MTKKDHILIAEVLYNLPVSWETTKLLANNFARKLKKENPRFNKRLFIKACLGE